MHARKFNSEGIEMFKQWLDTLPAGQTPQRFLSDDALSESFGDFLLDGDLRFTSRYDFGCYLRQQFEGISMADLLAPESDGLWAWISALYFAQLAPTKVRRSEHYIPIRRGSAGSLLHRNAPRTAYELVVIHGVNAQFVLQQGMPTHGQLLESLSASQNIVRNVGFFAAAAKLYVNEDGKLKRGATSKPKKPKDRKPGDESGKGSIRRLPFALKRLDLTYDVEELKPEQLIALLPKEYARWTREPGSRS
jgi:hypothetical protein